MQLKLNNKYIRFNIENSGENNYVCFCQGNKHCFIVDESEDFKLLDKRGVLYKKITSNAKFFEFILKHNPETYYTESWIITVSAKEFKNEPYHYKSKIDVKTQPKCTLSEFVNEILKSNLNGAQIMQSLELYNIDLFNHIKGRGFVDISNINTRPDVVRYSKFHKFIRTNWNGQL